MAKPQPAQPAKVTQIKEPHFESASEFTERMKQFPPVFFDARDGSYWFKPKERFLQLSSRSLSHHFHTRGLSKLGIPNLNIRQIDWPIYNAELNNVVDYAGPLAGHRNGLYKDPNGKVYLVTEEAKGVWDDLPKTGEPEFFLEFVQELLPGDQWLYFCYWLSLALRSLRNGDFKAGQAIIFAGPAQCGKSLLQYIITHVLGGRSADPFKYMFGATNFNYDLIKAEHWMFEDPPTSTDIKTRREFGERLKECCNNDEFRAHKKNKDGEMVRIFRRVTGSINNETEHLAQVPPMGEGTADKIFLFKCERAFESMRRFIVTQEQPALHGMGDYVPKGQQDRKKVRATIQAELPVLRGWLLRQFARVPDTMIDNRMGIQAWHHPELLTEINSLAPEERLLQLLDQVLWDDKDELRTPWTGKSMQLEHDLRQKSVSEVERLFRFSNACGAYLGKLVKRHPHRISNRKVDGYTVWNIIPPPKTKEEKNGV
jgi:hypothetical protein